jgi:hypothetical protein
MMLPSGSLAVGTLVFFWLLFMLADYSREKKKRRGLDSRVRSRPSGFPTERTEYQWYTWIQYLLTILLTYFNTPVPLPSQDQHEENPIRLLEVISLVIIPSIVLLLFDGLWERKRRRSLSRTCSVIFWSCFWLRYPVLIVATRQAAKLGLQP